MPLLGGFGGMFSRSFFKWCEFIRFEVDLNFDKIFP